MPTSSERPYTVIPLREHGSPHVEQTVGIWALIGYLDLVGYKAYSALLARSYGPCRAITGCVGCMDMVHSCLLDTGSFYYWQSVTPVPAHCSISVIGDGLELEGFSQSSHASCSSMGLTFVGSLMRTGVGNTWLPLIAVWAAVKRHRLPWLMPIRRLLFIFITFRIFGFPCGLPFHCYCDLPTLVLTLGSPRPFHISPLGCTPPSGADSQPQAATFRWRP
mmetsp:Transcript_6514/g.11686  ORF Transcript_6514/g.11686 Transcript_6514/m.11686 type:complete len:220 (+) Transcript_6514:141-800(+)